MKIQNKKVFIVGLSFILTAFLFVWGFNFLKGKDIFDRERIFFVEYEEVNGLVTSNPVMLNGLRVGQVKDIYFHPNLKGSLIVMLSVHNKFPLPANSVARIFSSDLMGSKAVDLQLGDSEQLLQHNDTLLSAIEASLMDEVNAQVLPLKNKAESLISSLDSLVIIVQTILNETAKDNITASLQSVSSTIKNLERTTSAIDSFVTTEQSRMASILYNVELITRNIEQSNSEISRMISNLAALSDSLVHADIASLARHADATIQEMNKLMSAVNEGRGTVGQLMVNDSLYIELEKSAAELNKLLEDVRLNPKRYVKFSLF